MGFILHLTRLQDELLPQVTQHEVPHRDQHVIISWVGITGESDLPDEDTAAKVVETTIYCSYL